MVWYKVVAVFGFIQSLSTIGSLLVSQPILFPLNDFESLENQSNEQLNRPGILSIYELIMALCSLVCVIMLSATKPKKSHVVVGGIAFLIFFILSTVFCLERASTLGVLDWFGTKNTCKDTNALSGCPTTVFKESNYTIETKDHCKFNAYGTTIFPHDANNSDPLIDWSNIEFYDIVNKQTLYDRAKLGNNELSIDDLGPISYCWYWACDSVCNESRYALNQFWLMASLMNAILYLLLVLFSGLSYSERKEEELKEAADYPLRDEYVKVKLRY